MLKYLSDERLLFEEIRGSFMDKDLEIQQSGKCAKQWASQNRKWVVGEEKPVEEPQVGWSEGSLKGKSG